MSHMYMWDSLKKHWVGHIWPPGVSQRNVFPHGAIVCVGKHTDKPHIVYYRRFEDVSDAEFSSLRARGGS